MENIQIVVVEDNPDEARMTLKAIARVTPHITVRLARDGEEALKILVWEERLRPELIFLDLKLPKIHGFEVLRTLREDSEFKSVPIVVYSSSADPGDIDRARLLGADDYICKPMDWNEYANAVCEACTKYLTIKIQPLSDQG